MEMNNYYYGMRLRGFAPGCQPTKDLIGTTSDNLSRYGINIERKYHDILAYNRQLDETELAEYELDYLGKSINYEDE